MCCIQKAPAIPRSCNWTKIIGTGTRFQGCDMKDKLFIDVRQLPMHWILRKEIRIQVYDRYVNLKRPDEPYSDRDPAGNVPNFKEVI